MRKYEVKLIQIWIINKSFKKMAIKKKKMQMIQNLDSWRSCTVWSKFSEGC